MLSVTRTRNAIESVKAFYCLFISVLEIQLSEEEGWDSINWFNLTTLLCLSQARTWISNPIFCCPFCVLWFEVRGGCHIFVPVPSQDPDFKNHVQWSEVRGDCLFYLYWWNCWPSLCQLSFRNFSQHLVSLLILCLLFESSYSYY